MQRILVFTDSRGQYRKTFPDGQLFTEQLPVVLSPHHIAVDLMLCPFKWTTTLDFIELVERGIIDPLVYDRIVLWTGIVEWSPRNESNWIECVHGDDESIDQRAVLLNPYRSKRIANDKLRFLRHFFGEADYDRHARQRYVDTYRGEPTQSLISPPMLESRVIPWLKSHIGDDKLIILTANRILPDWEGNYRQFNPEGRPPNIGLIADYTSILASGFSNVIDLLAWSDNDIQQYTVDNIHLTPEGSDWMRRRLLRAMGF